MLYAHLVEDTARSHCDSADCEADNTGHEEDGAEQHVELFTGQLGADIVNKGMNLTQAKYSKCLSTDVTHCHILQTSYMTDVIQNRR